MPEGLFLLNLWVNIDETISPCDVFSGEGTDEPAHVFDLKGQKNQVGWVVYIHGTLRVENPVSGLRPHILLITFCWTFIYPEHENAF